MAEGGEQWGMTEGQGVEAARDATISTKGSELSVQFVPGNVFGEVGLVEIRFEIAARDIHRQRVSGGRIRHSSPSPSINEDFRTCVWYVDTGMHSEYSKMPMSSH